MVYLYDFFRLFHISSYPPFKIPAGENSVHSLRRSGLGCRGVAQRGLQNQANVYLQACQCLVVVRKRVVIETGFKLVMSNAMDMPDIATGVGQGHGTSWPRPVCQRRTTLICTGTGDFFHFDVEAGPVVFLIAVVLCKCSFVTWEYSLSSIGQA